MSLKYEPSSGPQGIERYKLDKDGIVEDSVNVGLIVGLTVI